MGRGSVIAVNLIRAGTLLTAVAGLYGGWLLSPYYLKNFEFKERMESRARIYGGSEGRTEALRDAIYRDAQDEQLPLRREDIQVEYAPSGSRVAADYTVSADLQFFKLPLHFHPQYPPPKQPLSPAQRFFLAAGGFILGLYWFLKGFGLFREYRVLADTPLVPIRSIAMGRVQIQGKAVGEKTLLSPLSNQPCFLYKVEIERWSAGRSGSGRWLPDLTDEGSVGFYLADDTGKVLIDPRSAELDLVKSSRREVSKHELVPLGEAWRSELATATPPGFPASDSELRRYVARVASGMDTTLFQGADLTSRGNARTRRKKSSRGSGTIRRALLRLLPVISLDQIGDSRGATPGDYRLTEYCVLPETEYNITGTCAMNPAPQNGGDRQVVQQGQNDPTFLISHLPEKVLEQDLHARAWRHILGGGLLAIGGAAALLEAFGLIL